MAAADLQQSECLAALLATNHCVRRVARFACLPSHLVNFLLVHDVAEWRDGDCYRLRHWPPDQSKLLVLV